MNQNYRHLEELTRDIFALSSMLYEFSKNYTDTEEEECLHTGLKILHSKANELNLEIININNIK